jgi:primase-polymerase (primpol)-like protein
MDIALRIDSYTEVSPSGAGLRIWTPGVLPPGGRRKGYVEMYDGGRYLTVTGHRVRGVLS